MPYEPVYHHPKTLRDHCLAILCKTRPITFSSTLTLPLQLIPDVLERLLVDRDEGGLPFTIVNQVVEHLSDKGILSAHILELLLRQSRGSLDSLHLSSTQLTFDDFLRLPPLAYLVDFDCTNVDHVTDALWEKLTPSRTSLRSFAAIGLDNPAFHFERIAEFSNVSSLNLSNTCVSVDDVIMICRTLAESLTALNVSECSQLNLLALLPGIRLARNLTHLSLHDLPVAKDVTDLDKEIVLSTFKDAFNCLSSLTFLDVGWIKDAGTVTGWDVACVLLECLGSRLTHVDVSGLATLCETLRFVKDLGIERSLQYLGALHTNLRHSHDFGDVDDDDDDDADSSVWLDSDLKAEVEDMKIVATGFEDVDEFVAFQPHYISPTPRNHAILKLIGGRLLPHVDDLVHHWAPSEEEADVLSSFVLRRCRADRRWRGDTSYSYPILGYLASFTLIWCTVCGLSRESVLALLHEIIVRALSTPPSFKFAANVIRDATYVRDTDGIGDSVDLEQIRRLLVIAFCHLKCSNTDSDIRVFSKELCSLLYEVGKRNALRDVGISQGFVQALLNVLESSLALSQSPLLSETIVDALIWFSTEDAEVFILVARQVDRFADILRSLYDTLDEENVRKAERLLNILYLLSVSHSDQSFLEKPSLLSLIWKSLNLSYSRIQRYAADLFALLALKSSTPFLETTTSFDDGLSAEKFWQRIAENCVNVPPPTTYESYCLTKHSDYYLGIAGAVGDSRSRMMHTLRMVLSCLENDLSTLQSPVLVYALSTLTSYVLSEKVTKSEDVQSRIAKILRSLTSDAREKNEFIGKLIETIQPYVRGWKV